MATSVGRGGHPVPQTWRLLYSAHGNGAMAWNSDCAWGGPYTPVLLPPTATELGGHVGLLNVSDEIR